MTLTITFQSLQERIVRLPNMMKLLAISSLLVFLSRAAEALHQSCHICDDESTAFAQDKMIRDRSLTCYELNSDAYYLDASDPVCESKYKRYANYCECSGTRISCPVCPDGSAMSFPERLLPNSFAVSNSLETCGDLEVYAAMRNEDASSIECMTRQFLADWCGCPTSRIQGRRLQGCELCNGRVYDEGSAGTVVQEFAFNCQMMNNIIAPSFDPGSDNCIRAQQAAEDVCCQEITQSQSGGEGDTAAPVTLAPVTAAPTTSAPVTPAPVTMAPVTSAPVTVAPVTSAPVTAAPVTSTPVTSAPATAAPVTSAPVTPAPTTAAPVSSAPATMAPVSPAPVTLAPITAAPVTAAPTVPTTPAPTPLETAKSKDDDGLTFNRPYGGGDGVGGAGAGAARGVRIPRYGYGVDNGFRRQLRGPD